MKMNYFVLSVMLIIFILLPGCDNSSDSESGDEYSVLLYEEDNGTTIEIDLTEKIIIELQSNPSTGYHWEHSNTDGTFINQDGEAILIEDEQCVGLDGCGGTEQLSFIASQTGTGSISLVYHRSFEEDPAGLFSVDVVVTE